MNHVVVTVLHRDNACISAAAVAGDVTGRLHHLQERMKPVMASEVEVVVQEERSVSATHSVSLFRSLYS